MLLYYLLKPRTAPARIRRERPRQEALQTELEFLQELSVSARRDHGRGDLVYQYIYVDHCRIRP
jgi:hypothetical protein